MGPRPHLILIYIEDSELSLQCCGYVNEEIGGKPSGRSRALPFGTGRNLEEAEIINAIRRLWSACGYNGPVDYSVVDVHIADMMFVHDRRTDIRQPILDRLDDL